jgi:biopolymer transport protein ExbD
MASNPGFTQACPFCQIPLLLRDPAWIGKLVECPKCHQRFVVEDPAKRAAAAPAVAPPAPAPSPPPSFPATPSATSSIATSSTPRVSEPPPPRSPQPETSTAPAPAALDRQALIQKDKDAVRRQEQARREALIQKDREAVRGKQADGDGVKTKPSPPAGRDKARLALERLYAGGRVAEGKSGRPSHRKTPTREEGGVNLSIIITPMLDMAFQLMAFFVMTYHPSALEGHIDASLLPPSKIAIQGKQDLDKNAAPVDVAPDDKDALSVIVKAVKRGQTDGKRGDGEPSQIFVKRAEEPNPELVADTDVDLDTALRRLRDRLKAMQTKGTRASVNIEADSDLKHQYTIRIYDACKSADCASVGFRAPPDGFDTKK